MSHSWRKLETLWKIRSEPFTFHINFRFQLLICEMISNKISTLHTYNNMSNTISNVSWNLIRKSYFNWNLRMICYHNKDIGSFLGERTSFSYVNMFLCPYEMTLITWSILLTNIFKVYESEDHYQGSCLVRISNVLPP